MASIERELGYCPDRGDSDLIAQVRGLNKWFGELFY